MADSQVSRFQRILVTGHQGFINRYRSLFEAMSHYVNQVDFLPFEQAINSNMLSSVKHSIRKKIYRFIYPFSSGIADSLFEKNRRIFTMKSLATEKRIRQLSYQPDMIVQVFCLYCPVWENFDIPYSIYLDYTMALAIKNWAPWAPFSSQRYREDWLECEQKAYQKAYRLFTMNETSRNSLISDYGISPEKVFVVGSAGNFRDLYEGGKEFGTQQILFTGTDFERKGGRLVLEAFRKIRAVLPKAKLVIIGTRFLNIQEPGVSVLGKISSRSKLQDLFLASDLILAPSFCEPFQAFLLEALNYGVPCIVSNRDGMPEIIEDGKEGLVIQEQNPEIFANRAIELLLDQDRLSMMSKNAQEKVKHRFNWDDIAKTMLRALETKV